MALVLIKRATTKRANSFVRRWAALLLQKRRRVRAGAIVTEPPLPPPIVPRILGAQVIWNQTQMFFSDVVLEFEWPGAYEDAYLQIWRRRGGVEVPYQFLAAVGDDETAYRDCRATDMNGAWLAYKIRHANGDEGPFSEEYTLFVDAI
jgi:hypothetical protein